MRVALLRRAGVVLMVGALSSAVASPNAAIATGSGVVPSTSPIVSFGSGPQLDCTTSSVTSDWLQFFSADFVRPAALSCATVVSVSGFGLFGPRSFADTMGLLAGTPLKPYAPISQTITPSSSRAARKVVTLVGLPGTGLLLRQTDSYVNGGNTVTTTVDVGSLAPVARDLVVYRTGDCFPGSDLGFGISGGGAVGCEQAVEDGLNAVPVAGPVYMRWAPTVGVSHFDVGAVVAVRGAIGSGHPLADSCDCSTGQDIAAALSWSLHLAPGQIESVAHRLTYSPLAGRAPTQIVATATGKTGATRLEARLTSGGVPIPDAPIAFVAGSLPACVAVTGASGTARCTFAGSAPEFVARYRGDVRHRPVTVRVAPDPLPPPPPNPSGFPACAHFNGVVGEVTGGDAHSEDVIATTSAPPCPIVRYTAVGNGAVIGEKLGDLRATDLFGHPVSGFADLFIGTAFGQVGPSCIHLTATDTRTGAVLDTFPDPTGPAPCMTLVAGQKFR